MADDISLVAVSSSVDRVVDTVGPLANPDFTAAAGVLGSDGADGAAPSGVSDKLLHREAKTISNVLVRVETRVVDNTGLGDVADKVGKSKTVEGAVARGGVDGELEVDGRAALVVDSGEKERHLRDIEGELGGVVEEGIGRVNREGDGAELGAEGCCWWRSGTGLTEGGRGNGEQGGNAESSPVLGSKDVGNGRALVAGEVGAGVELRGAIDKVTDLSRVRGRLHAEHLLSVVFII